jgi:hypothetical protein
VGNLYYENRLSVTFEGTKYIRLEHTGTEELYDLAGDPRELSSRAATDPDLLGEGRRLLERLQAEAADLRRRLGVDAPERMQLSEDELEVLRGIGYAGDS